MLELKTTNAMGFDYDRASDGNAYFDREVAEALRPIQARGKVATSADYDDGLLSVAGPAMIACYVFSLMIMAVTLFGDGVALFMIAISAFYLGIYFAVPKLFLKMRNELDPRFGQHKDAITSDRVEIFTGTIDRGEALLQMLLIPIAVVLTLTSFCIISLIQGI